MNHDPKKIAADCYKRGTEALAKQSFDYAVKMYMNAAQLVPDSLHYRQVLRGAEEKFFKGNKKVGMMASGRAMAARTKIKKARMSKDWRQIDTLAEEGLQSNPWDAQLNASLGEAARELGFDEVAIFAYERAVREEPNNKEFNKALGLLCEERGNYKTAIECWTRIYKLDPNDGEARSKIMACQAKEVMDHGGYEGAESTRQVKTGYDYDRPTNQKMPETVQGPGVSIEADLQHAIRKNPADHNNYLKLASHYVSKKQLDEAFEMLQKALEVSGGDQNIREQMEDVGLQKLQRDVDTARSLAAANPQDQAAQQRKEAVKREFMLQKISILTSRVERYKTDTRLKFDLAQCYMKVKQYEKAIPLLQAATADVRTAGQVAVALAQCFIAMKQNRMAIAQLERAIPKIDLHDNPQLFCEAHYYAGRLCEEAGQKEMAEQHYLDVLGVDFNYKDTRARLERLQLGDQKDDSAA